MKRANTRISVLLKEQLDQKLWYERLNLVNKFKRMCQRCTGNFSFWLAVGAFSSVEPILCSYRPVGIIFLAQVAVLAASSVLYIIQLVGCASREWDKIVLIQAMSSSRTIITVQDFTPFKVFIFFSAEGEYILEFCCLLGGWATIFYRPGLAVLRCFRVFRLLWFYEVVVFKTTVEDLFDPVFGAEFVARCFKVLKFSINALTALGNEMFRLTNATRGGLLLMLMFFYSAFVLGTTLWVETAGESEFCMTKSGCVYTLMRLTFYDGTGFDFTYSLLRNHTFLFFLCIAYMCVTSFGILNGLVGIFGTLFQTASDEAFNDDDGSASDSHSGSGSDPEADDGPENDPLDGEGGGEERPDFERRKLRTHRLASLVFRSYSHRSLDCHDRDHSDGDGVNYGLSDHDDGDSTGEGEGGLHTARGGSFRVHASANASASASASANASAVPFAHTQHAHAKDHQSPRVSPRASPRADAGVDPGADRRSGGSNSNSAGIALSHSYHPRAHQYAHHTHHASDEDASLAGPHGEEDEVWAYSDDDEGPTQATQTAAQNHTTTVQSNTHNNTMLPTHTDKRRRSSTGTVVLPPIRILPPINTVPPISRDSSKRDLSNLSARSNRQKDAALVAALAKTQYDSFSLAEKAEVQRRLAGKIGGASHFALMELKKMAALETQAQTQTQAQTHSQSPPTQRKMFGSYHSLHDARREEGLTHNTHNTHNTQHTQLGHFDPGKVYPAGAGVTLDPLNSTPNDAPATAAERRHPHASSTTHTTSHAHTPRSHAHAHAHTHASGHRHHQHPHAPQGMFGMRRQPSHRSLTGTHTSDHTHHHHSHHRPNPFAPKATHSHGHGSQTHSHTRSHPNNAHSHAYSNAHAQAKDTVSNSAEIKALAQQVQGLSRTVEVQNDMIIALFSQIQQSLRHQHPQQQQQSTDNTNTDQHAEQSAPEPEISFPEMAPSKNMSRNVARLLPAVTPLHPNAHAKPQLNRDAGVVRGDASTVSNNDNTITASSNNNSKTGTAHVHSTSLPPRAALATLGALSAPVSHGHAHDQQEEQAAPVNIEEVPPMHSLHIDSLNIPLKHNLEVHKSDLSAANSPITPATRSSTSTTSAEMSAFSLLAPELKNKVI